MDDALRAWAAALKEKGHAAAAIKAAAIKGGRQAIEIDEVLASLQTTPTSAPENPPSPAAAPEKPRAPETVKQKSESQILLWVGVGLIIFALLGATAWFFISSMPTQTVKVNEIRSDSDLQSAEPAGDAAAQTPETTQETPEETEPTPDEPSAKGPVGDLYCWSNLDGFWTYTVADVEKNRCSTPEDCIEATVTYMDAEYDGMGLDSNTRKMMLDEARKLREADLAAGKLVCVAGDPNESAH